MKVAIQKFVEVIAEEANHNPDFERRLRAALFGKNSQKTTGRPRNKRTPAVLDPVDIADKSGEAELCAQLSKLDIEQLKDIVAQYGMDTANRVMKWKTREKIVGQIVGISTRRARKGDAFRIPSMKRA